MESFTKHKYIKDIAAVFIIFAITICIYFPTLFFPFLPWDDQCYVYQNPHLRFTLDNLIYNFTHSYVKIYLPITMLSYMVDYLIMGYNPFIYHLQNLFWHLVTAGCIYACFRHFKLNYLFAFFAALIWSVHPQRVESVVWIAERKDVLCGAFYFMALLFYLKKDETKSFHLIPFSIFILACLSKPMAVTLSAIFVLYDFHRHRSWNPLFYIKRIWPYILVCVIVSLIALSDHTNGSPYTLYSRLIIIPRNLGWYVMNTLYPQDICYLYPRFIYTSSEIIKTTTFYIAFILLLLVSLHYLKKKRVVYSSLPVICCFLASISPVAACFQAIGTDYADRYTYIPSVFIWFAIFILIKYIKKKYRIVLYLSFAVYSLFLAKMAYDYSKHWKSKEYLVIQAYTHPSPNFSVLIDYTTICYNLNSLQNADAPTHEAIEIINKKIFSFSPQYLIMAYYLRWRVLEALDRQEEAHKYFKIAESNITSIKLEKFNKLYILLATILHDENLNRDPLLKSSNLTQKFLEANTYFIKNAKQIDIPWHINARLHVLRKYFPTHPEIDYYEKKKNKLSGNR